MNILCKYPRPSLPPPYKSLSNHQQITPIESLIFNLPCHLVSVFKDWLIYDETCELLKRSYSLAESKRRLPKITGFYESYNQLFPSYVTLDERKYMFCNIQDKQADWDSRQRHRQIIDERKQEKNRRWMHYGGIYQAPSEVFKETEFDPITSPLKISSPHHFQRHSS